MCVFFGEFSEKRTFCLLAPPKWTSFLPISNENIFFKTQGIKLGAIVAPNKGLELALVVKSLQPLTIFANNFVH